MKGVMILAQSKVTLIGIENYLNPDRSVFDKMQLPDGIDKETLIGAILLRCQEFELLYSDPDFLIDAVNIWSRKNYWTFDKWVKAINIKYDPLHNYDRTEEYTDKHSGNYNKQGSGNSSGNTSTVNDLKGTNDVTNTHSERGFNASDLVNNQTDVSKQSTTDTGTVKGNYSNSNSDTEKGTDDYTNIHKARLFGNIGVTTSQAMFLAEVNDAATWNMYEHIADLFASEFCIMVY